MDKKAQMMDAGTALVYSEEEYGSFSGRVKAELEEYGKVLKSTDIDPSELPYTTGRCDYFLDWSSPWRYRYISAVVEDASETEGRRRYAVVFKEGNRTTPLRAVVHLVLVAAFLSLCLSGNVLLSLVGVAAAGLTAFSWIFPSRKAVRTLRRLISDLSSL